MFELIIVNLQHQGFGESLLQVFEGGILLVDLLEWYILVHQVYQRSGNTSKSLDESSVKVGKP